VDPAARERVASEHQRLIAAVAAADRAAVIEVADAHRAAARDVVSAFIGNPTP
jgi:DNA-binding GntR family transcriptional regulator